MQKEPQAPDSKTMAKPLTDRFMQAVGTLEADNALSELNLIGGDRNSPNFEENKAKRQLITEEMLDILDLMLESDSVTDTIKQEAFRTQAAAYLERSGLRRLNKIYLYARGGDALMTEEEIAMLYSELKEWFDEQFEGKAFEGEPVLSPEISTARKETKQKVKKKGGGLELDEDTKRRLGHASAPESQFHKRGAYNPAWGRRAQGGERTKGDDAA